MDPGYLNVLCSKTGALLFLFYFGFVLQFPTMSAQPELVLSEPVISGLNQPIQFVNAGDGSGRVFIVHKEGLIKVYDADFNFLNDFLNVTNISTSGERGLLSMAFHPDYENNGLFYVYYTGNEPGNVGALTIARYKVSAGDPDLADPASKKIVLEIEHPLGNHNGGELHFDQAGYLYLSTGDGGGGGDPGENAQDPEKLLGKLLRLEVNTSETPPFYTVPADNPFGNEVYCLGLRNPYRWSFDRFNGDLWIGDVGQNLWEEFDHVKAGEIAGTNFGWDCYEGDAPYELTGCLPAENYHFPVFDYGVPGSQSVTGGVVYRGNRFPAMYGWYIGAEYFTTDFFLIRENGASYTIADPQTLGPSNIVDFGETEDGEVYVVSLGSGTVYQLTTSTEPMPLTMLGFSARETDGGVRLEWRTAMESGVNHFEVEVSEGAGNFRYLGELKARNVSEESTYAYTHDVAFDGRLFYRLKVVDRDGGESFSGVSSVHLRAGKAVTIRPTLVTNGELSVLMRPHSGYSTLEIVTIDGEVLLSRSIDPWADMLNCSVGHYTKGMYLVRLTGEKGSETHKVMIQ